MAPQEDPSAARAAVRSQDGWTEVTLSGSWRLAGSRPAWRDVAGAPGGRGVRLRWGEVTAWDSSVLVFLHEAAQGCRAAGVPCELEGVPGAARLQLEQFASAQVAAAPKDRQQNFLVMVGLATREVAHQARAILDFVGECSLGALRLLRRPRKFRWLDCVEQMQQCGAMALPIVSLISFLVGLTLAYQAALFAQRFGGDIYVADAVALTTVREMGPMMAAVILAGRTGAAFAATLGNMQAGEEIDALRTLGISPVDFLVLPRIVALGLMMPLLTLYANVVGILGGMFVAAALLRIPPSAYWIETQSSLDLGDVNSGLIKAVAFGLLIGLAGCLRGIQAERSAAGVGRAATSAVVTALLLLIVADALFAVLYNALGI